jgi:YVTN family beta-propeller protein
MSRRRRTVIAAVVVILAAAVISGWRAGWPPFLFGKSAGTPAGARFLVPQAGAVTDTPYQLGKNLYVNDPAAWSALPANSRSSLLAQLSAAEQGFRKLGTALFPPLATLTARIEPANAGLSQAGGTGPALLAARTSATGGLAASDYGATAFGDAPLSFGAASYAGYTGYQNVLGWVPCAGIKPQAGPAVKICGGQAMAATEHSAQAGLTGAIVTVSGFAAAQAAQPVSAAYTNHSAHDQKITVTGSAASVSMTVSAIALGAGCARGAMKYSTPSSGTLSPPLPSPPVISLGDCLSSFHEEVPIGPLASALGKGVSLAVNIVNFAKDAYDNVTDKALLASGPALKACASGQMLSDVAAFITDFGGIGIPTCQPAPLPAWSGTVPAGATVTFTATPATQVISLGAGAQADGLFTFVHLHVTAPGSVNAGTKPNGPAPAEVYAVSEFGAAFPVNAATNTAGKPIQVGSQSATAVALTPDGSTAYVTSEYDNTVTPVSTATGTAGTPIQAGPAPTWIAITPDGKTAYVTNQDAGTVTPISTATNTTGTPIQVGGELDGIAISPDGKTAYVTGSRNGTVTPITTATGTAGTPIQVGGTPQGIAVSPDGKTAYVADSSSGTVTPINLATGTTGTPIQVSAALHIAITPDGKTAYVTNPSTTTVTPIDLASGTAGSPIQTNCDADGIAITPDGKTAYLSCYYGLNVTPITIATNTVGTPIPAPHYHGGLQAIATTYD